MGRVCAHYRPVQDLQFTVEIYGFYATKTLGQVVYTCRSLLLFLFCGNCREGLLLLCGLQRDWAIKGAQGNLTALPR